MARDTARYRSTKAEHHPLPDARRAPAIPHEQLLRRHTWGSRRKRREEAGGAAEPRRETRMEHVGMHRPDRVSEPTRIDGAPVRSTGTGSTPAREADSTSGASAGRGWKNSNWRHAEGQRPSMRVSSIFSAPPSSTVSVSLDDVQHQPLELAVRTRACRVATGGRRSSSTR